MKRLGAILVILLLAAGISACKKENPYKAEILVMENIFQLLNEFTKAFEEAKDVDSMGLVVINALPKYKDIKPKIEKIREKYSKFGQIGGENSAPKELQPYFKRIRITYELLRMVVASKSVKFRKDETGSYVIKQVQETLLSF